MRGLQLGILLFVAGAALALPSPQTESFAPLYAWRQAILTGDQSALTSLYSTDPRRQLMIGQQPETLGQETAFWGGLHAAGVKQLNPKVLSIEHKQGAVQLVLRVSGQLGDDRRFVVSMAQLWGNMGGGWQIMAAQRSDLAPDTGRSLPEPVKPNPNLYGPPQAAKQQLINAEQRAGREHKRVLVVFGANWCYDCHVLDATLRSANFAPLVNAHYVVVHINIGDEGKDNNDLAHAMGVAIERGTPNLAVLQPDGKVVVAQTDGAFTSTTKIGPQDVRAFLEKYK